MINDLTRISCCSHCGKHGHDLRRCAACKLAAYCDSECQRTHWPVHKARCLENRKHQKLAKEDGMKRNLRLLTDWKEQVRNGILGYIIMCHFQPERLKHAENEHDVVFLTVDFDYNVKTFLPSKEPVLVPVNMMENQKDTIESLYKEHRNHPGNVMILIFLVANKIGSIMPLALKLPPRPPQGGSWKDLQNLFKEVRLSSSKFDSLSWRSQMKGNLQTQIEVIRGHGKFQSFLVSALQIESREAPLHKSHVIIVFLELGRGLGEVKKLERFAVWPMAKALTELRKHSQVPESEIDHIEKHILDLDSAPELVQSQMMRPNNCLVPVLFIGPNAVVYGLPSLMEIFEDRKRIFTVKQCKKRAEQAFAELQQVPLPDITSPALD